MSDSAKGFIVVVLSLVSIFLGIAFLSKRLDEYQLSQSKHRCQMYSEFHEVPTRWNYIGICELQMTDGTWLPLSY